MIKRLKRFGLPVVLSIAGLALGCDQQQPPEVPPPGQQEEQPQRGQQENTPQWPQPDAD